MKRRNFTAGMAVLTVLGPRVLQAAVQNPLPAEGVELTYKVSYGEQDIGQQTVSIRQHDDAGHVVVAYRTKLKVKILFTTAYELDHNSTEVWNGFTLRSLRSKTIEDGEHFEVEGQATDDGFRVRQGLSDWTAPNDTVTSDSFWVAAALTAPNVINARSGETSALQVTDLGNSRWRLEADFDDGPIKATLRFDGDFLAEAEVDSGGHLVNFQRV